MSGVHCRSLLFVACFACACGDSEEPATMDVGGSSSSANGGAQNASGGSGSPGGDGNTGGNVSAGGSESAASQGGSAEGGSAEGGVASAAGGDSSTPPPGSGEAGAPPASFDAGAAPMAVNGMSPYITRCMGDSAECGDRALQCLGVRISADVADFACSNRCETVDDCSDAPSGTDAEVDCVQLTQNRHCLLVCQRRDVEYACPQDMECYVFPGATIGYCLYP